MSVRQRRCLWILLGVALLLVLLGPVLSSERTLIYRDCVPYTAPLNHLHRAALSEGKLLEWNPTQFTGVPFLANPSTQSLYPPRWAAVLLTTSPAQASDLFALLHLALALFGCATLGRELGLKRGPRCVLALTYTLGGPLLSLLGNLVYLVGAAWLPLSLAWILRARRKAPGGGLPFARALGLAAAGLAPPFFAGDPQSAGWLALLALVVLLAPGPATPTPAPLRRRLGGLVALGGTTFLLAFALLLPAALLAGETTRGDMSYTLIGTWSFHPARLAELLIPYPLGLPFPERGAFVGGSLEPDVTDLWTHTLFLGAGAVLLVIRGLLKVPRTLSRARNGFACLALVALVLACGRYTPLHPWLAEHTPYGIFRYPEKHLTLVSLALAALAGIGLQAWLPEIRKHGPRRLLPFLALPALTLALAWALSSWTASLAGPAPEGIGQTRVLPPALESQALSTALVQLWLLGVLALNRLSLRQRATAIVVGLGLTSLSILGPLVFEGPAYLIEDPPPTVEGLRQNVPEGPFPPRVVRFPVRDTFGSYPTRGLRQGEGGMLLHALTLRSATCALYDLEGLLGMTGYYPKRLTKLKEQVSWPTIMNRGAAGFLIGPLRPPPERPLVDVGLGIGVYPLPSRPRLELLTDLHWVPSEEAGWAALAEVSTRAVVAVGPGPQSAEARSLGSVRPAPSMGRRNEGLVRVVTEAESAGVLVLRDAWFPGWEARVDGQPAPILHVDGAFMGVALAPGSHEVELSYQTPGFRPGLAVSLPAWLLLVLFLGTGFRRRGLGGRAADPATPGP